MYVRMLKQSRGYHPGAKVFCGPGGESKGVVDLWLRARIAEKCEEETPKPKRRARKVEQPADTSADDSANVGAGDATPSEEATGDSV